MKPLSPSQLVWTASKNQLREQIAEKAAVLSGALAAYASVNGNEDMLSNGYLTKTEVIALRDVNLPERLGSFIDLMGGEAPNLTDYGVTEAQVTDLAASVGDFREMIGQPLKVNTFSRGFGKCGWV